MSERLKTYRWVNLLGILALTLQGCAAPEKTSSASPAPETIPNTQTTPTPEFRQFNATVIARPTDHQDYDPTLLAQVIEIEATLSAMDAEIVTLKTDIVQLPTNLAELQITKDLVETRMPIQLTADAAYELARRDTATAVSNPEILQKQLNELNPSVLRNAYRLRIITSKNFLVNTTTVCSSDLIASIPTGTDRFINVIATATHCFDNVDFNSNRTSLSIDQPQLPGSVRNKLGREDFSLISLPDRDISLLAFDASKPGLALNFVAPLSQNIPSGDFQGLGFSIAPDGTYTTNPYISSAESVTLNPDGKTASLSLGSQIFDGESGMAIYTEINGVPTAIGRVSRGSSLYDCPSNPADCAIHSVLHLYPPDINKYIAEAIKTQLSK